MATITDIKKQRRAETRFSVYIDGKYAFALSDLDLSMSGLRVGQEVTADRVAEFQEQAGRAKIYALAVRYVAIRQRSRREVADYLHRRGYGDEESAAALERLTQAGLLNDREFAAAWVANRQALKPRSRRALAQELTAKGVAREDIEAELGRIDAEAERLAAVRVADKKRRLSQYSDPQKLLAYLMRQGYSYEAAKGAAESSADNNKPD